MRDLCDAPVHRAQVALLAVLEPSRVEKLAAAVAVPDLDALCGEHLGVGAAVDEPDELLDDAAREDTLGGQEWENELWLVLVAGGWL